MSAVKSCHDMIRLILALAFRCGIALGRGQGWKFTVEMNDNMCSDNNK